jgi:hypothetical protein
MHIREPARGQVRPLSAAGDSGGLPGKEHGMHDAKGRELKVGDVVVLKATITELHPTEEYCNVGIESEFGRRPDGAKERVSAINTGVLLRANPGDE